MTEVRVTSVQCVRVTRALAVHRANRSHEWVSRQAVELTAFNDAGIVGRAEASPLPGYSSDTLEQSEEELRVVAARLPKLGALPIAVGSWRRVLAETIEEVRVSAPAARCAVETALLDLAGQVAGSPAWRLLTDGADPHGDIDLSALVDADDPRVAASQVREAAARGIRTFKVKVGREGRFEQELEILASVRDAAPPESRLRVDANRAWSSDVVDACLARLAQLDLECIEEPCADGAWCVREALPSPVPVAADESLADPRNVDRVIGAIEEGRCSMVVLKPMIFGGITTCLAIADRAMRAGGKVIVTHAFDGPLGLASAATLALAFAQRPLACGLDALHIAPDARPPWLHDAHVERWSTPGLGLSRSS